MKFVLYSTLGCHLCEQAEAMLEACLGSPGDVWKTVEIADSDTLFARYGETIPVVQSLVNETELGWPFDEQQLALWLRDKV